MDIIILFVNISSLLKRKILFESLLLEEKAHAFLLNETHLTPKLKCKFSGYSLIRHDSTTVRRANGGVAIGHNSKIPARTHQITHLQLPEYLIATIYFHNLYVTLITIYVRPGHPIPLAFFQYIYNNYRTYIIMADINIHSRSDRQKLQFTNYISQQTNGLLQQLPQHTRPTSQTTPDVVILSPNLAQRCHIDVLDNIGSGHVPMKLTIRRHLQPQPPQTSIRKTARFDLADWNSYRTYIDERLKDTSPPTTEDDLYQSLDTITDTLQEASKEYIPTTTSSPYRPKLPPQYLTMVKRSRQLFRDYLRSRNPAALQQHRQLQRMVHNYLKAYKLRQWVKPCHQLMKQHTQQNSGRDSTF